MIDELNAALPVMRQAAESQMTEQAVVRRRNGVTTNPTTGAVTPDYLPVYSGKCKIQTFAPYERSAESGSSTVTVQRYQIHFPVGAGPFKVGDLAQVGQRKFRIASLLEKTRQTAQRLFVDEVTG